jgi:cytochrome c556
LRVKKTFLVGSVLAAVFLLVTVRVFLFPLQQRPAKSPAAVSSDELLPAALDALYPPAAKEPVFLLKMLGLAHTFSGILSDLFENDPQNALTNYERFKAQYGEAAGLVPEWKAKYPAAPVEELGTALKTGDQAKVIAAVEKVGGGCSGCHVDNMAKVQHKYGWPDFSSVRAKDPLSGEEIDLHRLMVYLDISFTGISADIEQGQAENARKQYQGFKARFDTMASTCEDCHGPEERKYYVDSSVRAMMDELEKTIAGPSVEKEKAEKLHMGIGMESCHKCHQVHIPAAFAQKKWRR